MKGISFLEVQKIGTIAIIEEKKGISSIEFLRNNNKKIEEYKKIEESTLTKNVRYS